MLGPRRARDMQGYKEVAGGGLDVALSSPLSTGRTSQLDTCKSLIRSFLPSFIHSFSQRISAEREPQCPHL